MSKQVTPEQREYLFQIYTHKFLGCDLGKLRKEFDLIMKYDNKYKLLKLIIQLLRIT